ncbi:hypothetical protein PENSPDRAFT_752312 [Peniophora sp. CONT]|nr:hypothetical protein PENSPDRAFT_752312 [Peniophora sp. CONT]
MNVEPNPDALRHSGLLSLPCELLEQILHLIAIPSKLDEGCYYPEAPWIEATHACRRLRHVALNCPLLWTNVHSDMGPDWVNAFFERSESSAPLTYVESFSTMDINSENHIVLSEQMHRVREMHIACLYVVNEGTLDAVLSAPAPLLERCSISISSSSLPLRGIDLFSSNAPRLRHLSLSFEAGFPWRSSVLNNLTRFEVTSGPLVSLANTTSKDVLDALGRMHKLEHLALAVSLAAMEWDGSPVDLSHLEFMHLASSFDALGHVLPNISFPSSTKLSLSGYGRAPPLGSPFLSHLAQHYASNDISFTKASVSQESRCGTCSLTFAALHTSHPLSEERPDLQLTVKWGTLDAMHDVTEAIYYSLPFDSVNSLVLDGFWGPRWVYAIFLRSQAVTYLRMYAPSVPSCLAALARCDTGDVHTTLFPNLEVLSFPNCTWTEWSAIPFGQSQQAYELLALAIRKRRERGKFLCSICVGEEGSKARGVGWTTWAYDMARRRFPKDLADLVKPDEP